MDKLIWIMLVALAGALLPIQAGLNTKLGRSIDSPVWASLLSFVVGLVALLVYVAFTKQGFQTSQLKTIPGYTWLGGLIGAFYVTITVLAFPKLGPALTFGLIVGGQLFVSLLLDHFNILVQQQSPINIYRIIGIIMIIAGVVIIRKF